MQTWRWIFFINVPIALLSLFLTSRLVEDPPHIQQEVKENRKHGLNLAFDGCTAIKCCARSWRVPRQCGKFNRAGWDDAYLNGLLTLF